MHQGPGSADGARRWTAIVLGALMLIIFIVSVFAGRLSESVQPATSVQASKLTYTYATDGRVKEPYPQAQVTLLTRTVSNSFVLPVPVPAREYKFCLRTASGASYDLYSERPFVENYPEVSPGKTETVQVGVQPISISQGEQPREVLVYTPSGTNQQYSPCNAFQNREPQYRIPVE